MEILLVVAILSAVSAVVLPQFQASRERQTLKNAAEETASALRTARARSLSSEGFSEHGVRFEADRLIIFKGTDYSSGAPDNQGIDIYSPVAISNVTLNGISGSSGELYFTRITGFPSKTGTITLSSPSHAKTVTVSATGAVVVD